MKSFLEKVAIMSLGTLLLFGQGPSMVHALEIVISENGSDSSSTVEAQVESTTTVEQNNEASVSNDVETAANTGENDASQNTGGDVEVTTGDVTQDVTASTSVNSSEVDVGCCPGDTNLTIEGNGADSNNEIRFDDTQGTEIAVNQKAIVKNNINGTANTGENSANKNTGANVSIDTGDIFVSGGIENGPINIASVRAAAGSGGFSAKIAGNGADSENKINVDLESNAGVFLNFNSYLNNFVNWDLNTGRNNASGNTGGDINIQTGDIFFDFFIKNIANIGKVDVTCCPFDPGEPPGEGGSPPAGGPDKPHDPGGDDGGGDDGGDGDGGDGGSIASGAATEAGGPGIAGLSDTSSENAQTLFFFAGIAMILGGARILATEAHGKQKKNS